MFPSCVQWDTFNVTFRFHPNYSMFIRTGEALFVASAFDPVTYGGWDAGMLLAFLSRQDVERMNIAASEKYLRRSIFDPPKVSYTLDVVSKSVLDTLRSVKKCLIWGV